MTNLSDIGVLLASYIPARRGGGARARDALERHQARAFQQFQRRTLARSPFYAPFAGQPLAGYPIMTKPLMLDAFDRINTAGISREEAFALAEEAERTRDFSPMLGDISVGLSTGTSGQRGLFLASRRERMRWAGMMLGRMLPGSLLARHRIAFLLRANNSLYESVSGKGRIAFRFFDLKRPLDTLRGEIADFAPSILIAPAQVLRELARREGPARAAGAGSIAPAKVISVAETLFDDDRAVIKAAFGQRVAEIYQATEGFLGYTCRAGRLHLNEAFLHIEPDWIDREAGHFSPVITDFCRDTQPIVRFRLDDVLREDPRPCPCGSPERVVARIEGRADDILVLRDRTSHGERLLMPDFLVRALAALGTRADGVPLLDDFRVVQTGGSDLTIRLAATDLAAAANAAREALRVMFADHALEMPRLAFEPMTPADVLQKRRRVVRTCAVPSEPGRVLP